MSSEHRRPLHLPVPLQRFPPPAKPRRPARRRRRGLLLRGSLMLLAGASILVSVGVAARRFGGVVRLRQAAGAVIEALLQLLPRLLELGLLLGLVLLVPAALLLMLGGVVRIGRALRRAQRR